MIEESGWPGDISVPDLMLPVQFFAMRRTTQSDPERRLMLEVLKQGIEDFQNTRPTTRAIRLHLEAVKWIQAVDQPGPFGFDNLCAFLDLDAGEVRRALRCHDVHIPRTPTTLQVASPTVNR
jgi:hypothetical protein